MTGAAGAEMEVNRLKMIQTNFVGHTRAGAVGFAPRRLSAGQRQGRGGRSRGPDGVQGEAEMRGWVQGWMEGCRRWGGRPTGAAREVAGRAEGGVGDADGSIFLHDRVAERRQRRVAPLL